MDKIKLQSFSSHTLDNRHKHIIGFTVVAGLCNIQQGDTIYIAGNSLTNSADTLERCCSTSTFPEKRSASW